MVSVTMMGTMHGRKSVPAVTVAARAVAFWMAIGLIVTYPAIIVALQQGVLDGTALVGTAAIHGVALILGRNHRRDPTNG